MLETRSTPTTHPPHSSSQESTATAAATHGRIEHNETTKSVIRGKVIAEDGGEPIADARVWIAGADDDPYQTTDTILAEGRTDNKGQFALEKPRQSFYYIKASKLHFATVEYNAVSALSRNYLFRLPKAAVLVGQVVDQTSSPVAGAGFLVSQRRGQGDHHFITSRGMTNEAGFFSATGIAETTASVSIKSRAIRPYSTTATLPDTGLICRVSRYTGQIEGTLQDCASSSSIQRAAVQLLRGSTYRSAEVSRETTSTDTGGFRFDNLSTGTYFLRVTKEGTRLMSSSGKDFVSLTLKDELTPLKMDLMMTLPAVIKGRVLDSKTSEPISEVSVSLSSRPEVKSVSDADGNYSLEGVYPQPNGRLAMQVTKPGYVLPPGDNSSDEFQANVPLCKAEHTIDIKLFPYVKVRGKVVSDAGQPLPEARVAVDHLNRRFSQLDREVNAAGEFELEVPPFSRIVVKARAPGWAEDHTLPINVGPDGIDNILIRLTRATYVRGIVVNEEGVAVDGAEVGLRYVKSPGIFRKTKSAKDGSFSFDEVPSSPVGVAAAKDSYLPSTETRLHPTAEKPAVDVKLVLRKVHSISGRVLNDSGSPLKGAHVRIVAPAPPPWAKKSVGTDSGGKFSLIGLPGTSYDLVASHADYKVAKVTGIKAGTSNVEIRMEKSPLFEFTGNIVDMENLPVANALVTPISGHGIKMSSEIPGQFKVLGLSPRAMYRLLIHAPPLMPLDTGWKTAPAQSGAMEVFQLGMGGSIRGTVINKVSRQPVAGVAIEVTELNSEPLHAELFSSSVAISGPDGTFQLREVPTGVAGVSFLAEAPPVEVKRYVTVANGSDSDLGYVELSEAPSVKVTLIRNGQAVPNTRIVLSNLHSSAEHGAITDSAGECEFLDIVTGHYKVSAPDYDASLFVDITSSEQKAVVINVGQATLRGRIVRGGAAARGSIRLMQPLRVLDRTATLDDSGAFEVADLTPEVWSLVFYSTEPAPVVQTEYTFSVDMSAGSVDQTFEVPSGTVQGRVNNAQGQPVPGCTVTISRPATTSPDGTWERERTASTVTDSTGRFAITGFPQGIAAVSARKSNLGTARIENVNVPFVGMGQEVTLVLGSGGTLISSAFNLTTGQPIPQAWCYLRTPAGLFNHKATRNSQGIMRIENIPAGNYAVEVSAYGFSVSEHQVTISEGTESEITDVLYEAGALRLSCIDALSNRLAGVSCTLEPLNPDSLETTRNGFTDGNGELILRGLRPGTYRATGTTSGSLTRSETVEIIAHQPTSLVLTLSP